MHDQNRSGFFVPPHPDVPDETHHTVLTYLTAEQAERAKRQIKKSQLIGAATAEYREQSIARQRQIRTASSVHG